MSGSAASLVARLRREGIHLYRDGGKVGFRCLPGALLPEQRTEIAARRDEILACLDAVVLPPDSVEDYPASAMQRQIYLAEQISPGRTTYNMPHLVVLPEMLDPTHVQQALNRVIARQAALRTTFHQIGGEIVQRVHPTLTVGVEVLEQTTADPARFVRAFDLARGPLLRVGLAAHASAGALLCFDLHHLIGDDASLQLLQAELLRAYRGEDLPPLRYTFGHYAVWEKRQLAVSPAADYWRRQLEQGPPPLDWSRCTPTVPEPDTGPQIVDLELAHGGETAAMRDRCAREQMTPLMLAVACEALLLTRWTFAREAVIGVPTDLRRLESLQPVVGPFVSILPVRVSVDESGSVREYLAHVRAAVLGALEHGAVPCDADALGVAAARRPGWDAVCLHRMLPEAPPGHDGVSATPPRFGLSFTLVETPQRLWLHLERSADFLGSRNTALLARQFQQLWRRLAADPLAAVREVSAHTQSEREELERFGAGPRRTYPSLRVDELFMRIARARPDAPAVRCGDVRFTFRELAGRVVALAERLRKQGLRPNDVVPLVTERGVDMMVGVLGALRAGGAYLPINPHDPAERIEFLLRDSGARLVAAQAAFGTRLPAGTTIVPLESEESVEGAHGEGASDFEGGPVDHLAYIIYTSGSTGRPKGVMIEHRGIMNRLAWMAEEYAIGPGEVILQKTPYTFDVSVWELLLGPVTGAETCMLAPGAERDPALISQSIRDGRVTMVHFVPTMLQEFVATLPADFDPGTWKRCLCSGEALRTDQRDAFFEKLGGRVELHNLYGPTEASVDVTFHAVQADDSVIPIGRPVANTRLLILDAGGGMCPVGVAGELCLGGVQLARGYLNRPELTDSQFRSSPQGRYYRTGDLARWLSDGDVEYLGRLDAQVKIRGQRIELGEIEAVLAACPGVKAAAVACWGAGADAMLAGYVVVAGGDTLDVEAIQRRIAERLPEAMVPASIMLVPELPLTSSGKLDRKRLPRVELSAAAAEGVLPEDPDERTIAGIFADVLGLRGVSAQANFFRIGGHSLKAVRAVWRIEQAFGVRLTVAEFFAAPTPGGLAGLVRRKGPRQLMPIPAAPAAELYPITSPQKRMFVLHQFGNELLYNVPGLFLIEGALDAARLEQAFAALAQRHEGLRTSFQLAPGGVMQKVHATVRVDYVYRERMDEMIADAAAAFVQPFDLAVAPLWRVQLVCAGDQRHFLFFDVHHIVCDEISLDVMIRDLGQLYAGRPMAVPAIHYKDYAVWQQRQATGSRRAALAGFWVGHLAEVPPAVGLPHDRDGRSASRFAGAAVKVALDGATARRVVECCQTQDVTLYMFALAAYAALLGRYAGSPDVVVGSIVAGREHPDLADVVGMFANTIALRARPDREKTVAAYLVEIKRDVVAALEHATFPFEELLEELDRQRDWRRHPLFRAMFAYKNDADATPGLVDLQVSRPEGLPIWAKFELTLTVHRQRDGIELRAEYPSALYDAESIERFCAQLAELMGQMAAAPEATLATAWRLGPAHAAALLRRSDPVRRDFPRTTVHELFAEQVRRSPEAVALIAEGNTVTYRELNERANRLARKLRALGAGRDVLVAIMLERSVEMVVAILAIWKSGAAYVPIDPAFPAERVRYLFEDSGATLMVARAAPAVAFAGQIVLVDASVDGGAGTDVLVAHDPAQLAYVIYTSGSTGRPKAVLIEHASVVNYLVWAEAAYLTDETRCFALCTALTFDLTVTSLFTPLISGRTIKIFGGNADDGGLLDALGDPDVHAVKLTPSQLQMAADANAARSGAKVFVVGGEDFKTTLARSVWERYAGRARIFNEYGPTETTVGCMIHEYSPEEDGASVGIGRAAANVRLYVLDEAQGLLPVGAAGELCIGGPGLARGYLNQPQLTAERFIPNPYARGERLYRSGDRARWLADGTIEFLGRMDEQVKIRGHRVELGEIESVLGEIAGITAAAVVVRIVNTPETCLCAYYVATRDIGIEEVRTHLRARLPVYMIPAYCTRLEQLPLSLNGKLDRGRLPDPLPASADDETEAPIGAAETLLAETWKAVLRLDQVGRKDNFFHLGGDSIKAMQVVARLRAAGFTIRQRELFEADGLAAAARLLVRPQQDAADVCDAGPAGALPVHQWFAELPLENRRHWNQAGAVKVKVRLDDAAWRAVWTALANHHDILRATWDAEGRMLVIRPRADYVPSMDVVPLDAARPWAEQLTELSIRLQASLDLAAGPLFRVGLLRGELDGYLVFVAHHAIMDGVSWRVLSEDLLIGVSEVAAQRPFPPLPRGTSFAGWAAKIATYAKAERLRREFDYWAEVCATPGRALSGLGSLAPTGELAVAGFTIDAERSEFLLGEAPRLHDLQPREALLAAVGAALGAHFGAGPMLVMLEGHGREDLFPGVDVSRTVGWFTSLYPAVVDGSVATDVAARLAQTKARLRAIPGNGLGYGILRYVTPLSEEDRSRLHATPQVCFNYLGEFDAPANAYFDPCEADLGPSVGGANVAAFALEVNIAVQGRRIAGRIAAAMPPTDAQRFAATLEREIAAVLDHCRSASPAAPAFTKKDLSTGDLEAVLSLYQE